VRRLNRPRCNQTLRNIDIFHSSSERPRQAGAQLPTQFTQAKICLLGEFAVGKTSLVRRFVEGRFEDKYLSTIGVKISHKFFRLDDHQLNLVVWDLAGEEKFAVYQSSYIRGASGAIMVCDLSRHETLEAVADYAQHLRLLDPGIIIVFAANKVDLEDRKISDEELQQISDTFNSPHLLTSAKTGEQVERVFQILAERILRK